MSRRIYILRAIVIAVPLLISAAFASVDEDIPPDSWIYPAIEELTAAGDGPPWLLHTQPFTRRQVASYLHGLASDTADLDPGRLIVYRRLFAEFAGEVEEIARPAIDRIVLRTGIQPYLLTTQAKNRDGLNRAGGYLHTSVGRPGHWLARTRVRLDSDARYDTRFRGKPWKDNLTANIDDAYLKFLSGNFEAFWGRGRLKFGRSANDGLLLSGWYPPLDYGRLSYSTDRFRIMYFIAVLDNLLLNPGETAKRYLAGHRIDLRPWDFLELAAGEVIVFGGVNRPLEWNYLNPLTPYYWEQLNEDHDDNPLWNVEWSLRVQPGWEVYGEFLIDDFQIDFKSEPHQLGILIGAHAVAPFGMSRSYHTVEYSRVNTTVYGQNEAQNRYYYRRDMQGRVIPLGSRYGPDTDRWLYTCRYHAADWLDISAGIKRSRKGQRDIEDIQTSGVAYGVPFPSGVVDQRWDIFTDIDFQYRNLVFVGMHGGWSQRENEDNIAGNDQNLLLFEGRLLVNLQKIVGWTR